MRLCTVIESERTVAAVERGAERCAILDERGLPYRDVQDLLRRARDWRAAADRATQRLRPGLPLARPVLAPGAVACVGLNYREHIREMQREPPAVPTWFAKLARALTDPEAEIVLPAASARVDYEGELAVVIGAGGRDLPAARAWDAVLGLTLLNDVSMRDWQKRSLQFFAGKTWERATPLGPVVVTPDELPDLGTRELVTRVNGEMRQRCALRDMVFDVPALVADLSRIVTLEPGDVIATGTPSGVGDAKLPPVYLRAGDVVEVEVAGIGTLRNAFVAAGG